MEAAIETERDADNTHRCTINAVCKICGERHQILGLRTCDKNCRFNGSGCSYEECALYKEILNIINSPPPCGSKSITKGEEGALTLPEISTSYNSYARLEDEADIGVLGWVYVFFCVLAAGFWVLTVGSLLVFSLTWVLQGTLSSEVANVTGRSLIISIIMTTLFIVVHILEEKKEGA